MKTTTIDVTKAVNGVIATHSGKTYVFASWESLGDFLNNSSNEVESTPAVTSATKIGLRWGPRTTMTRTDLAKAMQIAPKDLSYHLSVRSVDARRVGHGRYSVSDQSIKLFLAKRSKKH